MSIVRDLGMLKKVKEGKLPAEYAKSEFGVYKVQGFFDNTFMGQFYSMRLTYW
jgi:hypothetical protein